jgi:hypothetical protein
VPRFSLRIALSTALPAALPYFRPPDFLLERFWVAMWFLLLAISGEKYQQRLSTVSFRCNVIHLAASKTMCCWQTKSREWRL